MRKQKPYNVIRERIKTNKDFTINLVNTIYDTYLGADYIKTNRDVEGHFNWCYGKILDQFYDEGIDFYGNDELYDYFFDFFKVQFYQKHQTLSHYERFWKNIFDYKKNINNKKIMSVLLGISSIFDKSYMKKVKDTDLV